MSKNIRLPALLGVVLLGGLSSVHAETVTPLKGQTPEMVQSDVAACQSQTASTQSSSSSSSGPSGERLRGAATGAVAGAAAAQVRGNQHEEAYDRVDEDVQQEYRQNQAKQTAAAGVVVGGSKQRRERRDDRGQESTAASTSSQAYIDCMVGKGYSVIP